MFFYANEGTEPIHIHAKKAGSECKYWLRMESFDIEEEYAHGLTPALRREVRRIIFDHFDYIVSEWNNWFGGGI